MYEKNKYALNIRCLESTLCLWSQIMSSQMTIKNSLSNPTIYMATDSQNGCGLDCVSNHGISGVFLYYSDYKQNGFGLDLPENYLSEQSAREWWSLN